jgi:hypothetical protein
MLESCYHSETKWIHDWYSTFVAGTTGSNELIYCYFDNKTRDQELTQSTPSTRVSVILKSYCYLQLYRTQNNWKYSTSSTASKYVDNNGNDDDDNDVVLWCFPSTPLRRKYFVSLSSPQKTTTSNGKRRRHQ